MPTLTVIPGGGGGSPSPRMDELVEALWHALPASSYAEIRTRMVRTLHRNVSLSTVNNTIHHVRANSETLRWTIPHAQRGLNPDANQRYVAVQTDHEDDPSFTLAEEAQVLAGFVSTVKSVASLSAHEAASIRLALPYLSSLAVRRRAASFLRRMTFLGEEAKELAEMMEANGTT